jgi:hypothetical protein
VRHSKNRPSLPQLGHGLPHGAYCRRVGFTLLSGPVGQQPTPPLGADIVAKVTAGMLWNKNSQQRIGEGGFSNQYCASAPDLESILRTQIRKIVLQQYRP